MDYSIWENIIKNINNPIYQISGIPALLIALNSFLKHIGMPSKYAPIVNFLGGMVAIIPARSLGIDIFPSIMVGFTVGLVSGGFYDLTKLGK